MLHRLSRTLSLVCLFASFVMRGESAVWLTPSQPGNRHFTTAAFLKSEVNDRAVRRAVWRTTAGGVYEGYVNGSPVGGGVLKPGFTSLWKTRQETSVDVTDLLDRSAGTGRVRRPLWRSCAERAMPPPRTAGSMRTG